MEDYNFKLIDSTYSHNDGREVLLSLVRDKLCFLNKKIFSLEERFGGGTEHLKLRVKELEKEKDLLHKRFKELSDMDSEVQISCEVQLKIHTKEIATT